MSIIGQDVLIGENSFVVRTDRCNLEYNSTIQRPSGCKIVVKNLSTGSDVEWTNSRGDIINPKPKGLFNHFKKADNCDYTFFFVSTSPVSGKCGGNVQCKNESIKELQYETIFYRVTYEFSVVNVRQFLKSFLREELQKYSKEYFTKQITDKIKPFIEEKISLSIAKNGLANFSSNVIKVKNEIEKAILEDANGNYGLANCGIDLSISNLIIEENNKIKSLREDTELRMYQQNKIKED